MTDDRVAAYLADVRRRDEAWHLPFSPPRCCEMSQADVPALLAAVEAALKLADELQAEEFPDDELMAVTQGAAVAGAVEARRADGRFIREAVSAALLGEAGRG